MILFKKQKKLFQHKDHFLPIYSRQIALAVQAASALVEMMQTTDQAEWKKYENEVKQCEVQGDALLSEFYEEVYERMMSPMKRSDFQHLAMDIDDLIDQINASAKSLLLYTPEKIAVQLVDMAQYISSSAEALKAAVSYLSDIRRNFSLLTIHCERITELEHAADDAYEEYIGYIFREEQNAVEIMKYKNIAETLESATDSAKKISDRIRTLLLRYV